MNNNNNSDKRSITMTDAYNIKYICNPKENTYDPEIMSQVQHGNYYDTKIIYNEIQYTSEKELGDKFIDMKISDETFSIDEQYDNIFNPLDQFEIRNYIKIELPILFDIHINLTNIGLYATMGTILIITLILLSNNLNKIIYNK